jgi:hypothetical protein
MNRRAAWLALAQGIDRHGAGLPGSGNRTSGCRTFGLRPDGHRGLDQSPVQRLTKGA